MTVNHKLSIVIIGRNEELGIGKCIEAALAAAEQVGGAETIYVDSHSNDNTVSVVKGYGVQVLELAADLRLSPSAGRFMGSQSAQGDFILFLDADAIVYPNFLPKAFEYFDTDAMIGGINGYMDDLNEAGELMFNIEERSGKVADTKWLRGPCCLYRREALRQVGSFNPDLANEEEAELGLRMVRNGWKLKVIPQEMACHTRCYHGQSIESVISTFRRDIRSKRLGEITKTIAYAFRAGNGIAFCWLRLKTTILFCVWFAAIALCLLLPAALYPYLVSTSLALLGGTAIFVKKRSLSQTLLFAPAKILCLVDILAGINKFRIKTPRRLIL